MNAERLGFEIATWRRDAGLTQAQLAERMGTKQPVISRAEAGRSLPTLPFLERFATACGRTGVVLSLNNPERELRSDERRRRVKRVLGDYVFNPWDRNPSAAEERSLLADGLTRERFQRTTASSNR